jgi:diketogulonate reductase-like aldo/keto reductase
MRVVELPDGTPMPALGLGTWRFGESTAARAAEVAAVRGALELGYRLIDTAEMYGEGGSEEVVGEALAGALAAGTLRREDVHIVSKVYPHNASRQGTLAACDRSRRRLRLDRIDVYLLHWRGSLPLEETVDAMRELVGGGRIGHWGVSNFDVDDMEEVAALTAGDATSLGCATNQVYYSPGERGVEHSLLPWLRAHAMPLMAYSPIDQGRLAQDRALAAIGKPLGLSAAQLALAWVLAQPGVVAIPKAGKAEHLKANLESERIVLDAAVLRQIDASFSPPKRKSPLSMI